MDKLGLVLAVAAIGVAGYVAVNASDRAAEVTALEQGITDLQNSVGALEAKIDALGGFTPAPASMTAEASGGMTPIDEASGEAGLATRDAPAAMSANERLAALEKTIAEQKDTIAKLEDGAKKENKVWGRVSNALGRRFYHNVDAAAKALELTDAQKQNMEDVAERARRDLKDLMATPNDDGMTWKEAGSIKFSQKDTESNVIALTSNMMKLQKFKKTTVPGTNETYGQAEKRIKDRAFADMREDLTPKQAETFDKAHKDAMLGTRSGMSFAFTESVVVGGEDK